MLERIENTTEIMRHVYDELIIEAAGVEILCSNVQPDSGLN